MRVIKTLLNFGDFGEFEAEIMTDQDTGPGDDEDRWYIEEIRVDGALLPEPLWEENEGILRIVQDCIDTEREWAEQARGGV